MGIFPLFEYFHEDFQPCFLQSTTMRNQLEIQRINRNQCKTLMGRNFFIYRVVNTWCSPPRSVVTTPSLAKLHQASPSLTRSPDRSLLLNVSCRVRLIQRLKLHILLNLLFPQSPFFALLFIHHSSALFEVLRVIQIR